MCGYTDKYMCVSLNHFAAWNKQCCKLIMLQLKNKRKFSKKKKETPSAFKLATRDETHTIKIVKHKLFSILDGNTCLGKI